MDPQEILDLNPGMTTTTSTAGTPSEYKITLDAGPLLAGGLLFGGSAGHAAYINRKAKTTKGNLVGQAGNVLGTVGGSLLGSHLLGSRGGAVIGGAGLGTLLGQAGMRVTDDMEEENNEKQKKAASLYVASEILKAGAFNMENYRPNIAPTGFDTNLPSWDPAFTTQPIPDPNAWYSKSLEERFAPRDINLPSGAGTPRPRHTMMATPPPEPPKPATPSVLDRIREVLRDKWEDVVGGVGGTATSGAKAVRNTVASVPGVQAGADAVAAATTLGKKAPSADSIAAALRPYGDNTGRVALDRAAKTLSGVLSTGANTAGAAAALRQSQDTLAQTLNQGAAIASEGAGTSMLGRVLRKIQANPTQAALLGAAGAGALGLGAYGASRLFGDDEEEDDTRSPRGGRRMELKAASEILKAAYRVQLGQ